MPHAVAEYNKFMRGEDLCDMFLELYRIDFKSKKWYMRIFFYVLSFILRQSMVGCYIVVR